MSILAFFVVSSQAHVIKPIEANKLQSPLKKLTDYGIYRAFRSVLNEKICNDKAMVECVIETLQKDKAADNFYSIAFLTDPEAVVKEIQTHLNEAYKVCKIVEIKLK
jgi:uncharacterized membrane protein